LHHELIDLTWNLEIDPGKMFNLPLDEVAEDYRAMHEPRDQRALWLVSQRCGVTPQEGRQTVWSGGSEKPTPPPTHPPTNNRPSGADQQTAMQRGTTCGRGTGAW
jgi:hypothetical protein